MPKFMIAYHGGDKPSSQEEGIAHMKKWNAWVESLGEAIVHPGTPLPTSKIITYNEIKDDTSSHGMNGFSIIKASSMEAAIEIAKSDPFLDVNGTIRVSQMMDMP